MLAQVPAGYVDPSSLAAQYPTSAKPSLPASFVAPNLTRQNVSPGAVGAGGLVVIGLGAAALWWASSRGDRSRSRGDR
jgi:hypothetical protein